MAVPPHRHQTIQKGVESRRVIDKPGQAVLFVVVPLILSPIDSPLGESRNQSFVLASHDL